MNIVIDTHTHTVSSGHAYSTIQEIAREAADKGLRAFAVTDHGPAVHGCPQPIYFGNLRVVPDEIYGVKIIRGVEANIISYDGEVDIPDATLKKLDFVLASFHDICIKPGSMEENTNAVMNALKNPYIDAVAHPGNPAFQVDIEKVVRAAKHHGKLIEINNHSFVVRKGSEANCREFALKCKQLEVPVVCGSDAHMSFDVGRFDRVSKLLEEVGMPEELVLNTSMEKFEAYLKLKSQRISS